jgi:hypothetical protein
VPTTNQPKELTIMQEPRQIPRGRSRASRTLGAALVVGITAVTVPALGQPADAAFGPPGDTFSQANIIVGARGGAHATNEGATAEAGEPSHATTPTGLPDTPDHSVWFTWTAPASARVIFRTKDSSIDTVMAAYTGSSVSSLTQLASNDDTTFTHPFAQTQSQIAFAAVKGTVYHIAVDSFTGSLPPELVEVGEISLSWDSNDDFAAATALPTSTSASLLAFADNDGATIQKGEPVEADLRLRSASVWFRYQAPQNGQVQFTANSSDFQSGIAAYRGSALRKLTLVAAGFEGSPFNNGVIHFKVKAGTTYRIAVVGQGETEAGNVVLSYGYVA